MRSQAKRAAVEALGADLVVDTTEADFVAAVKDFTDGRGADVVIDPIGGEVFAASRRCIAWEGRLVVVGFMSNEIPSVAANQVLLKNFSVVGLNMGAYRQRAPHTAQQAHAALLELYASGALRPVLHALGRRHRRADRPGRPGRRTGVGQGRRLPLQSLTRGATEASSRSMSSTRCLASPNSIEVLSR